MGVNNYRPHVHILPEDDANREMANGFLKDPDLCVSRIQVLEEVRGWIKVLDCFKSEHVAGLNKFQQRHLILLLDFDGDSSRREFATSRIPEHLKGRVFVLGVWTEPEQLRPIFCTYESIGRGIANDCCNSVHQIWQHALLRNNTNELRRLCEVVWPILFGPG